MTLKEIVSIAGVSGLHKIIGRTKSGLILESLTEPGKKFASSLNDKVSVLDDISMYTMEGDMRLAEVLMKVHSKGDVPAAKSEVADLRKFLVEAIQLDSERVYDSDIRKLMNWFHILKEQMDLSALNTETETSSDDQSEPIAEAEEKPKIKPAKTATPKSTAPKANTKGAAGSKNTYRPKSV